MRRQVIETNQPAVLTAPRIQLTRHRSAVETVGHPFQSLPTIIGRRLFRIDQLANGHRQVGLPVALLPVQDGECRLCQLSELHRAVPIQEGQAVHDGTGHGRRCRVPAAGDRAPRVFLKVLQGREFGSGALAADHLYRGFSGVINQEGHFTAETEVARVGHRQDQQRGHRCIGGMAATLQHVDGRIRRGRAAGCHSRLDPLGLPKAGFPGFSRLGANGNRRQNKNQGGTGRQGRQPPASCRSVEVGRTRWRFDFVRRPGRSQCGAAAPGKNRAQMAANSLITDVRRQGRSQCGAAAPGKIVLKWQQTR